MTAKKKKFDIIRMKMGGNCKNQNLIVKGREQRKYSRKNYTKLRVAILYNHYKEFGETRGEIRLKKIHL